MKERLYQVKVDGYCVAREMQIGTATLLARALFEFTNTSENLVVSIEREPLDTECVKEEQENGCGFKTGDLIG